MELNRFFANTTATWIAILVVVVGIIGINLAIALNTVNKLSDVQLSLDKTSDIIVRLDNLHLSIVVAESGQRGYLLTEYEEYLTPYNEALRGLDEQIATVGEIHSEIEGQDKKISRLLLLVNDKVHELITTVELALSDKENRAIKQVMTNRGRNLYREIRKHFKDITQIEFENRQQLYNELSQVQRDAKVNFGVSAIISGLLVIGMFLMARKNILASAKNQQILEQQNALLTEKVAKRTQELTIYADELSRSNRELEDFAFVASHDLQEPLRKIQAFSNRLITMYADKFDEKGLDYIQRMTAAARRMSSLINDLLEFSRITTRGKAFVSVDLNDVMEQVLADLEIAIKESDAQVRVPVLPKVNADPSQMYQLFLNVLSNGLKFRKPEQSPCLTVSCDSVIIRDELQNLDIPSYTIQITDNGIGFEQNYADKIFSPFQRLHGRSEYKGTGIGLAVCRRIVERHGGTISALSELGKGAVFIIILPVAAVVNKYMRE
ncbi:MAG: signal transduction histidine kinase [Paraglaciecola sp.]|jgi:signal transduction histidine kinase